MRPPASARALDVASANHMHEDETLPHPLTPEREKIQHELRLVGALNDGVDLRDAERIREVLAVYRRTHPDDPNEMQPGYDVIAACIEFPGGTSRAAARRYYDIEGASPLRRFVRRHCFEHQDEP
jgi:hypothetical protein